MNKDFDKDFLNEYGVTGSKATADAESAKKGTQRVKTRKATMQTNDDGLQKLGVLAKIYKKRVSKVWLNFAITLGSVFVVFAIIAIVIMTSNNNTLYGVRIENGSLQQDVDAQNSVLLTYNKQHAERILLGAFTTEQLENLAKDNWTYSVTVNNVAVTGDTISVKTPNIVIKINEKEKQNDLPESISVLGSISRGQNLKLDDIVKITTMVDPSQITSSVDRNDETRENTYTYSISNVPIGDIVTIDLGADLASRLRIKSGYIEIIHPSNS